MLESLRKQIEQMQQEMFPVPPEIGRPPVTRPVPPPSREPVESAERIEPEITVERLVRRERPVEDVSPEIRERPERPPLRSATAPPMAVAATGRASMTQQRQIRARLRSPVAIQQAILINEILGPPRALRDWNDDVL